MDGRKEGRKEGRKGGRKEEKEEKEGREGGRGEVERVTSCTTNKQRVESKISHTNTLMTGRALKSMWNAESVMGSSKPPPKNTSTLNVQ